MPDLEFADEPTLLTGGFFTENYAFTLRGAPAGEWARPLVLRLFPPHVPLEQARRESVVQQALAAQGFPAPRVPLVGDTAEPFGKLWLIMERMPGAAMLGDIGIGQLLPMLPTLARTAAVLADLLARLHATQPDAVVDALGEHAAGIGRWTDSLERAETEMPGFARGAQWLLANQPVPREPLTICHGDLWPGNVLVEKRRVTAVIDYSVATVAEPALDIGFCVMPFRIVPVPLPRALRAFALSVGRRAGDRIAKRYATATGRDLTNQPYYEAMRVALELQNVYRWRTATAAGDDPGFPRPTWDIAADRMIAHFRAISGVDLALPPPVSG